MSAQPLMIRCPRTGQAVPTGISMDPRSYESSGMSNNRSQCPACGETHVWSKENTFFGDESLN